LGPAGTAILRDVLVLDVSQIVGSVNCVPDESLWDVANVGQGSYHFRDLIARVLLTARMNWVYKLESGFLLGGHSTSSK
jgi:hypothetical protein